MVLDSSTVITPSLPTFFIASAMILPMVWSPFAEIVPTCAIISADTGFDSFLIGCGSFTIEAKAQSFNQIDGVLSVPAARILGDIDTPAGYLVHPRQV